MGYLRADGERRAVRFERRFQAGVDEVWSSLVEPDRLAHWLAEAVVDPRAGGRISLRFGDGPGDLVTGVITVFEPPRTLEYSWTYEGEAESVLRFELSGDERGTTLVLEHRLLAVGAAPGYGAGWHAHLDLLAEQLGHGVRSSWEELYSVSLAAYERQAATLSG
jgi:uncharacterized protein YndB with AHSA1/START domain